MTDRLLFYAFFHPVHAGICSSKNGYRKWKNSCLTVTEKLKLLSCVIAQSALLQTDLRRCFREQIPHRIIPSIQIYHTSSSGSDNLRNDPPSGDSIWWDQSHSLSEIRMSSPGPAANKRVWASSRCNTGAIICTEAIEILRGRSKKKRRL